MVYKIYYTTDFNMITRGLCFALGPALIIVAFFTFLPSVIYGFLIKKKFYWFNPYFFCIEHTDTLSTFLHINITLWTKMNWSEVKEIEDSFLCDNWLRVYYIKKVPKEYRYDYLITLIKEHRLGRWLDSSTFEAELLKKIQDTKPNIIKNDKEIKIQPKIIEICPECGDDLKFHHGKNRDFLRCKSYPICHYAKKTNPDSIKSTKLDSTPYVVKKRTPKEIPIPVEQDLIQKQESHTFVVANVMIGIGNKPFIRGDGPGLSWKKGVPMNFDAIGKWIWKPPINNVDLTIQIFRNDKDPDILGKFIVKGSSKINLYPKFC